MLSLGYFDDCIDSLTSRDDKIKLRKAWIIEFGEGVATGAATTAKVKQYLSAQEDSYRSPYGHVSESHQRHCAFAITTNNDAFLNDATGSRRFMVIDAEATDNKPWRLTAPHGKPWGFSGGILQKAYNRTALFRKGNSADFSASVFLPEQLT